MKSPRARARCSCEPVWVPSSTDDASRCAASSALAKGARQMQSGGLLPCRCGWPLAMHSCGHRAWRWTTLSGGAPSAPPSREMSIHTSTRDSYERHLLADNGHALPANPLPRDVAVVAQLHLLVLLLRLS